MTGPRIVTIGGGTGSYHLLTGLKRRDCSLTAVVTMMDSGGSSGRLRDEFGQLPPGDIRRCLLALAADDRAGRRLRQLFEYRFDKGAGLNGHSFGNLFLTALTELTGSSAHAIEEMARLLNVKGTVLPVTVTNSHLAARLVDGTVIRGEANIDQRVEDADVAIDYIYLEPKALVYPPARAAIEDADVIVIGPGDIYTSLLPNLVVAGVTDALRRSSALLIYVCNLMTKRGESDGFQASDFIREVQAYLGPDVSLDHVLVNTYPLPPSVEARYQGEGSTRVVWDRETCGELGPSVVPRPLARLGRFVRHDPDLLADAIFEIIEGGPTGIPIRRARVTLP